MKITKQQLKAIIKEELQSVLREGEDWGRQGSAVDMDLGDSFAGERPSDLGSQVIELLKPLDRKGTQADMLATIEDEGIIPQDGETTAEDILIWALGTGEIQSLD